jgi:8-oxo-dGTP pyrophosphatase MutT (NUDIX family)
MILLNPVALIALNPNNHVLLARRAHHTHPQKEGDRWSVPGGLANPGENLEEALRREIREELGCRIGWYRYFRSYWIELGTRRAARAFYFYGRLDGQIVLNAELAAWKWFSLLDQSLRGLDLPFQQGKILDDFAMHLRSLGAPNRG